MKRIPSFDNYTISETGLVTNTKRERNLKWSFDGSYYYVTLMQNGKRYFPKVHRLVAESFLPLVAGKNYVNHIDGNKFNNSVTNLEWVTASENIIHAYKNKLIDVNKKLKPKLTFEDAIKIREDYDSGISSKELALKYDITIRHTQRIIAGDFFRVEPNALY